MKPVDRYDVILDLMSRNYDQADVLDRWAVDEYAEKTGAAMDIMPYGANKCPQFGRDLSKMASMVYLTRARTGLTDMRGLGFPAWVWSYRLADAGRDRLELAQLIREEQNAQVD